jgi:hypothetical protein
MPYLSCPSCHVHLYTAATLDPRPCPRCGSSVKVNDTAGPKPSRSMQHAARFYTAAELARREVNGFMWRPMDGAPTSMWPDA